MPLTATKSFCRDRTCQLRLVRPGTDRQTTTTTTTPRLTPLTGASPPRQNPCAAKPATPKSLRRHAKTLILSCRTAIFDTSVPSLRSGTDNFECPLSTTFSPMSRVHCERGGILSHGTSLSVHSCSFCALREQVNPLNGG